MSTAKPSATRATQDEIFAHARALLGDRAIKVVQETDCLAIAGQRDSALALLKSYDRTLGGVGLHWFEEKRVLGVYRAFFYVLLPLRSSTEPQHHSREMIHAACVYLEELIKRMVRLNLFEKLKDASVERLPLGTLVRKVRKKIPICLGDELEWLAQGVYNFAKHKFNFEEDDEQPEHYFGLDEAIAVYLIARKLGLELEASSGKTSAELMQE
ncbi:MAG: hypothetical protein JXA33_01585 [Anaerolineae bacterium]|nr:hypothetical protein [Anaerolineae bacterium]